MVCLTFTDSSQSRIEPLGVYSENTKAFLGQTAELQCIFSGRLVITLHVNIEKDIKPLFLSQLDLRYLSSVFASLGDLVGINKHVLVL